ncbi:MAG: protein phosphatase 2C domain-containing protein [Clostridia bacterium]|nr:protein phosphatase 2C domain-containing protein [Clostridia bacterium]
MYGFYTDVGGRGNNEDSYLAIESGGAYLFVVADGLGGHEAGEVASGILVDELRSAFMKTPYSFDLEQSIIKANDLIMAEQEKTGKKMKTTATAAYIFGGRTYVANVGDSRLYLFNDYKVVFTTVDHSVAQMAVQAGEITPDQIRSHPDRNILTRALGSNSKLKVDTYTVDNNTYDRLLVCSDGFWEHVLESQMIDTARQNDKPDAWISAMRVFREAHAPKNSDNNTAVVMIKDAVDMGNIATLTAAAAKAAAGTPANPSQVPAEGASNTAPVKASGKSSPKKKLLIALLCLLLFAAAFVVGILLGSRNDKKKNNNAEPTSTPAATETADPTATPETSGDPAATETADPTATPETSGDPAATETADPSASPETSGDPAATETADPSASPEITDDPAASETADSETTDPGENEVNTEPVQT